MAQEAPYRMQAVGRFRVRASGGLVTLPRTIGDVAKMKCDPPFSRPGGDSRPWSLQSYPAPDPALEDHSPQSIATERLLWRHDGSLCAAEGRPYRTEDRPLLMTQDEWLQAAREATAG